MGYPLKACQERFVQLVVEGKSATRAYQAAYDCKNYSTAATSACTLLKRPHVRNRIIELKFAVNAKAEALLVEKAVTDLRNKEYRISKLADMAKKLENIMAARINLYSKLPGADYKLPGHTEGLIVPYIQGGTLKHEVDVQLVREYRATLHQIAEECGPDRINWTEDDGLKELARALESSPTEPPKNPSESVPDVPLQSVPLQSDVLPGVPGGLY